MICTPVLAGKHTDMHPTTLPYSSANVEVECSCRSMSALWPLLVVLIQQQTLTHSARVNVTPAIPIILQTCGPCTTNLYTSCNLDPPKTTRLCCCVW